MNRIILKVLGALACLFTIGGTNAQFYNNGSVIRIAAGGAIFCSGDITNATGGSISNDGVIEAQGSFINNGAYTSTTGKDTLRMSGTAAATLTPGPVTLNYLQVNKTSGVLTLGSTANVATKLDLFAGTLSTDPANSYELVAPVAAVFNYVAGTQVIGKVRRTNWTNATSVMFHQPNMLVRTAGGTAPTAIMVNMLPNGDPASVDREVKRYYFFAPTAGTGYTADVTFPYNDAELNTNTEARLVPWYYAAATEWNGKLTGNAINTGSNFLSSTAIPAASFANMEWKLADPNYTFNVNALLGGGFNGTAMNTSLNSSNLIPFSQPYNSAPFNYTGTESVGAIPNANVVDWVLVELRKPSSGNPADAGSGTIIGRKAGFLLSSGQIVNPDGVSPISFDINKQGPSFVAVRHLNHLGTLSNLLPSNTAGLITNDFTTLSGNYKAAGSASEPVMPLGTKYGLWPGDANQSGAVNAADISLIKSAISSSATGYQLTDVNRSATINATDVSLTKATIAASGSGSLGSRTNGTIKSNLPD